MVQEALLRIFAKGISQRKDGNTLISVSSSWDTVALTARP